MTLPLALESLRYPQKSIILGRRADNLLGNLFHGRAFPAEGGELSVCEWFEDVHASNCDRHPLHNELAAADPEHVWLPKEDTLIAVEQPVLRPRVWHAG